MLEKLDVENHVRLIQKTRIVLMRNWLNNDVSDGSYVPMNTMILRESITLFKSFNLSQMLRCCPHSSSSLFLWFTFSLNSRCSEYEDNGDISSWSQERIDFCAQKVEQMELCMQRYLPKDKK